MLMERLYLNFRLLLCIQIYFRVKNLFLFLLFHCLFLLNEFLLKILFCMNFNEEFCIKKFMEFKKIFYKANFNKLNDFLNIYLFSEYINFK